jgi:predicted DNA-binding transcriptional regulator AlpA
MPTFDPDASPLKPLAVSLEQADAMVGLEGASRSLRCKLIKRGDYPAPFNLGGRLVVAVSDLEALIERKRAEAPSELARRRQATAAAVAGRQAKRAEREARGETGPVIAALRTAAAAR